LCFSNVVSAALEASYSRILRLSSIRLVSRIRSLAVSSSISRVTLRESKWFVDCVGGFAFSGDELERSRDRNDGGEYLAESGANFSGELSGVTNFSGDLSGECSTYFSGLGGSNDCRVGEIPARDRRSFKGSGFAKL